jgi:DNA-binding CsgD family transcriptional regulator
VVGRRVEIGALREFLDRAARSEAGLLLSGPAGIGKTTLLGSGIATARADGFRILLARPTEAEAGLAFAGLGDLLAPIERELFDRLPAPQRRALDVALLREDAGDRPIELRAVAAATCSLLDGLASEQPTLLAVDDAQWLDQATDEVLRFALRRLEEAPLGVLAAVRTSSAPVDSFDLAIPQERRVELSLAPLSVAALHDILSAEIGASFPRPTLVQIALASDGNAFYAIEIARELQRLGTTAPVGPLPIPDDLRTLVVARVGRLPQATREALLLVAAAGSPAAELVDDEDLAAACDAGLVVTEAGGRARFTHPLVAAAVYEAGTPEQRRSAHGALAGRLQDGEERVRHLALASAGSDEELASAAEDAAARAASRGASASAAELARLAVERSGDPRGDKAVRRSLALAHHLLDAGEESAARDVLEECDASMVGNDLRAERLRDLGYLRWYEGEYERGYALLLEALEEARDPELEASIHRRAAWLSQEIDLPRAIAHADEAVARYDPQTNPGAYSYVLLHAAYLRLIDGQGADEAAYRRGMALQEQNTNWDDNSPVQGMWPLLGDDFAAARASYEAGLERSRAEGDDPSVRGTLFRLAEIALFTGDWEAADRWASESVAHADRNASTSYLGGALHVRGLLDAYLGRVDEARTAGERILELFTAPSEQRALGHWLLGFLALSLEEPAEAADHYAHAAEMIRQREPARFRFQHEQIEAEIQLGELDRAAELLEALEARGRVFPRPWLLATAARSRALLLAAEGDLAVAAEEITAANEQHRNLDMPFEQARTWLVEGQVLRRLKRKRLARIALEQARAEFERLGAGLWARRAEDELRRVAVRQAPADLSETELRIASLAAEGLSNRVVAERAFVSVKTVESNLKRAYRKLGISSRAQLGRALDERDAARTS